jgi:hypothetical protein
MDDSLGEGWVDEHELSNDRIDELGVPVIRTFLFSLTEPTEIAEFFAFLC